MQATGTHNLERATAMLTPCNDFLQIKLFLASWL